MLSGDLNEPVNLTDIIQEQFLPDVVVDLLDYRRQHVPDLVIAHFFALHDRHF